MNVLWIHKQQSQLALVNREASRSHMCLPILGSRSEIVSDVFMMCQGSKRLYCSSVWSPSTVGNINKLESVQRSFTKRLTGMHSLSYTARLKAVGLERLELRRLHADLELRRLHAYLFQKSFPQ